MTVSPNNIDLAFRNQSLPLFIPYVTAGHPSPSATVDILLALEAAGANIIELGVPYSDPLADGPTIQQSSAKALKHGVTLSVALDLAQQARQRGLTVPLILFTYVNPVLQMGVSTLCDRARSVGFDGLLVPDLPIEESGLLENHAEANGLAFIRLVAPTSAKRVDQIVSRAKGFVYCVSSLGTTGARKSFSKDIFSFLDYVRQQSPVPTAVGFGVSNAEHVQQFSPHVDAIIVGSALIEQIEAVSEQLLKQETRQEGLEHIKTFVRSLKNE